MSTNLVDHRHDDGVDIYHFNSITRPAIDEFYTIAMPIFQNHVDQYQDKVPLFYVLDLTDTGMFPVKYMMNKALQEIGKKPYQPQHYIAYVIANTQDQMLIDILAQLTARNLAHTRKVYKPEKLDDAIQWLKETRGTFITAT